MILDKHPYDRHCNTRVLGFWRSKPDSLYQEPEHFPNPADFVDPEWDPHEKIVVTGYLDSAPFVESYRGSSYCRICGKSPLGFREHGDGAFTWPEGFPHYVLLHSVKPPEEFLAHVRSRV